MKTGEKIQEKAVKEKVAEYFVASGYEVREEMRVKGSVPDIVAVKDDWIVMVEVKGSMGNLRAGIARAIDYRAGSHYSYLAVPSTRASEEVRKAVKSLGVGLIEVDDGISVTVKPERSDPLPSIKRRVLEKGKRKEEGVIPRGRSLLGKISKHRKVVNILLEYPRRPFTVRELSRLSGSPYATVWRLINDLYSGGVVHLSRIGGSLSCTLNVETPYLQEVKKIVEVEPSQHRIVAREFAMKIKNLSAVKRIVLFGSVARGEERPESDVDIAVIVGDKSVEGLRGTTTLPGFFWNSWRGTRYLLDTQTLERLLTERCS